LPYAVSIKCVGRGTGCYISRFQAISRHSTYILEGHAAHIFKEEMCRFKNWLSYVGQLKEKSSLTGKGIMK
jgi:hypothetical protein